MVLPSCLITQPVHFDPPANSPPAIDTEGLTLPLSAVVRLPMSTGTDAGTASASSVTLALNVYDPDVDQALQLKVLIDNSTMPVVEMAIPVSSSLTGRDRRQVSFNIDTAQFGSLARCHRITAFVSSQFMFGMTRPTIDHDIATATWWVAFRPNTDAVDMSTCP